MRSFALSLPCRAASRSLAFTALLAASACGTDDGPECTGGRVEKSGTCVCPKGEEFVAGQCRHQAGRLPALLSNVVDSSGDTGIGLGLAVDATNYPHVAYFESNNSDIRYATVVRETGKWSTETVEAQGEVGIDPAIALYESAGKVRPVVTYYSKTHKSLKGAVKTPSGWVRKFLDPQQVDPSLDRGRRGSVAVYNTDEKHLAHVSYLDPVNQDLYHVRWDLDRLNDIAAPRLVDSGFSVIEERQYGSGVLDDVTSIAVDSRGSPVIAYRDRNTADLKVARYDQDADKWRTEFVDNNPALEVNYEDLGQFASMAVDNIDNLHVGYYDRTNLSLRYAHFDGSDWAIETVDRGNVGSFASIAVREDDRSPFIAYFDASQGVAKIAHKRRSGIWQIEAVAANGIAGQYVRIALTDIGWPTIAYRELFSAAVYFDYILTPFP